MKNLFLALIILLTAGCTETVITPAGPDADASSKGRPNTYTFNDRKGKPHVIDLDGANFYLAEESYSGKSKLLIITDGIRKEAGPRWGVDGYPGSTYWLYIRLGTQNLPWPSYFYLSQIKYTFKDPGALFQTEDILNGELTRRPNSTSTINVAPESQPDFPYGDFYISVTGIIADGNEVEVSFQNVPAVRWTGYNSGGVTFFGYATLNFKGTIQERFVFRY